MLSTLRQPNWSRSRKVSSCQILVRVLRRPKKQAAPRTDILTSSPSLNSFIIRLFLKWAIGYWEAVLEHKSLRTQGQLPHWSALLSESKQLCQAGLVLVTGGDTRLPVPSPTRWTEPEPGPSSSAAAPWDSLPGLGVPPDATLLGSRVSRESKGSILSSSLFLGLA